MVRQAAAQLRPLPEKSDVTLSRAGIALPVRVVETDFRGKSERRIRIVIPCHGDPFACGKCPRLSGHSLTVILLTVIICVFCKTVLQTVLSAETICKIVLLKIRKAQIMGKGKICQISYRIRSSKRTWGPDRLKRRVFAMT